MNIKGVHSVEDRIVSIHQPHVRRRLCGREEFNCIDSI